ncbi:MAG: hypothetical protein ACKVKE_05220 [Candidatus Pelagibacterales bacterium]|jgi:hypothetical protein|tara:strand:+ start:341 stop:556 length:216 start_codon:yes stop_codon:yes gene_type:complete
MATVTNWIETLESGQTEVYPFVGTELWWLIACVAIWIIWHIIVDARETEELNNIASKNPGPNAHKDNITDW